MLSEILLTSYGFFNSVIHSTTLRTVPTLFLKRTNVRYAYAILPYVTLNVRCTK